MNVWQVTFSMVFLYPAYHAWLSCHRVSILSLQTPTSFFLLVHNVTFHYHLMSVQYQFFFAKWTTSFLQILRAAIFFAELNWFMYMYQILQQYLDLVKTVMPEYTNGYQYGDQRGIYKLLHAMLHDQKRRESRCQEYVIWGVINRA